MKKSIFVQFIIETSRILFNNNDLHTYICTYLLLVFTCLYSGTGISTCEIFLKVGKNLGWTDLNLNPKHLICLQAYFRTIGRSELREILQTVHE